MSIVASAILLGLGIAAYWRSLRSRSSGWLLGLRIIVLVLLAGILVGHVIGLHWKTTGDRVVMLADGSASITQAGADSLVRAATAGFRVPEGRRVENWVFADTAAKGDELPADKRMRTRFGRTLLQVIDTRPGAIVLFSDGQDNGEVEPVGIARDRGVPVYTIGCGQAGRRNLAVTRIDVPVEVYAGDTIEVRGRVMYSGLKDQEVTVRLGDGLRRVTLRDEIAEQEFVLRHNFPRPGPQVLRMSVDSVDGESRYADNERNVVIDVKPGRVDVAYVSNHPGPGTRFLTRIVEDAPRVGLKRLAPDRGGLRAFEGMVGDVDIFVLDGVSEEFGDREFWSLLIRRVGAGAGALILAGPEFRPGEYVNKLLPGGSVSRPRSGEFAPAPAGPARMLSWLGDLDFEALTPFTTVFEPGTGDRVETWLQAARDGIKLMTAHQVGKGRVVYVAGYPLWRWGFAAEGAPGRPTPLEELLPGIVKYLAEAGEESFRLTVERPGLMLGETVRSQLKARAPDGSAWSGLDVVLRLDSAGTVLPMTETAAGTYEAELGGADVGQHRLRAEVRSGDSLLGRAEAGFAVVEQDVETASIGLDPGLLRALAKASGAEYCSWDSLPGEGYDMRMAEYQRGFSLDPRRNPWVYVLIAVIAGLEWVLRRRKGLM